MRYIERYALALIVGVAVGAAGLAWAADSGGGGFEAKQISYLRRRWLRPSLAGGRRRLRPAGCHRDQYRYCPRRREAALGRLGAAAQLTPAAGSRSRARPAGRGSRRRSRRSGRRMPGDRRRRGRRGHPMRSRRVQARSSRMPTSGWNSAPAPVMMPLRKPIAVPLSAGRVVLLARAQSTGSAPTRTGRRGSSARSARTAADPGM